MTNEDSARLARIEAKMDSAGKSINILFHSIEGNGQPGLKERMTLIEAAHNQCQRDRQMDKESQPAKQGNLIQGLVLTIMVITCLLSVFGCTSNVIIGSSRCDVIDGTNTVEKLMEGGGALDAKASAY